MGIISIPWNHVIFPPNAPIASSSSSDVDVFITDSGDVEIRSRDVNLPHTEQILTAPSSNIDLNSTTLHKDISNYITDHTCVIIAVVSSIESYKGILLY